MTGHIFHAFHISRGRAPSIALSLLTREVAMGVEWLTPATVANIAPLDSGLRRNDGFCAKVSQERVP